jgi:hypothetical protein
MATREERVRKIIIDQLDVTDEQVTENASFLDDLAVDSLDTVELYWLSKTDSKTRFRVRFLNLNLKRCAR